MATVLHQNHHVLSQEPECKLDKLINANDIEYEISNWLKFESESPLGNSSYLGTPAASGNVLPSNPEIPSTVPNTFPLYVSNDVPCTNNQFTNSVSQFPSVLSTNSFQDIPLAQAVSIGTQPFQLHNDFLGVPSFSFAPMQNLNSMPVAQLPHLPQLNTNSPFTSQPQTQYIFVPAQFCQPTQLTNTFQPTFQQQPQQPQQPPQQHAQTHTQSTAPSSANLVSNNPVAMATYSNVPLYQLFSQFQQYLKRTTDDSEEKKKPPRPFVKRVRQTRPKVVESKGAVQCQGKNRKKGTQCRNAALMEYIGPRPIYCAEHIELDPKSMYMKCRSPYQKEPGDKKGCKEVVLKEFGFCYKHFPDLLNDLLRSQQFDKVRYHQVRTVELLAQLEKEAAQAKKKDGDLYQRKNKLIPKFQEMKALACKAVEAIDSTLSSNGHGSVPIPLLMCHSPSSSAESSRCSSPCPSDHTLSLSSSMESSVSSPELSGSSNQHLLSTSTVDGLHLIHHGLYGSSNGGNGSPLLEFHGSELEDNNMLGSPLSSCGSDSDFSEEVEF